MLTAHTTSNEFIPLVGPPTIITATTLSSATPIFSSKIPDPLKLQVFRNNAREGSASGKREWPQYILAISSSIVAILLSFSAVVYEKLTPKPKYLKAQCSWDPPERKRETGNGNGNPIWERNYEDPLVSRSYWVGWDWEGENLENDTAQYGSLLWDFHKESERGISRGSRIGKVPSNFRPRGFSKFSG